MPQVGIINPSEMSPANSIEIAIWVAVGGRGTLVGAIVGALLVNGAKSWFTVAFPEFWLFFLGVLFIVVTLFLPGGVVGLLPAAPMSECAAHHRRGAPRHDAQIGDAPRAMPPSTPRTGRSCTSTTSR